MQSTDKTRLLLKLTLFAVIMLAVTGGVSAFIYYVLFSTTIILSSNLNLSISSYSFWLVFAGVAIFFAIACTREYIASNREQMEKARREELIDEISGRDDEPTSGISIREDISVAPAGHGIGTFFDKVVGITFRYIESYYGQTQIQAKRSFCLSSWAAVVSFAVIIGGVVMLYQGDVKASVVTVSVGAFSQFISAVFFYLYNRTVLKMGEYHQKLVMTQNVMMAIRMTEDLPEKVKSQARLKLIETLTTDINMYLSPNPAIITKPTKRAARRKRSVKSA